MTHLWHQEPVLRTLPSVAGATPHLSRVAANSAASGLMSGFKGIGASSAAMLALTHGSGAFGPGRSAEPATDDKMWESGLHRQVP